MKLQDKLQAIEESLKSEFVEREQEIHGLTLAIMSDTNTLFLGPPGTGKSQLARRWAAHVKGANFFSWLLSQSTKDSEVLGPTDIKTLAEEGREVRNTTNKLPEAEVAFLDEIWKSSSALGNSLLKLMNERRFDNGVGDQDVPLLTIVAASNELPDTESNLAAALDRFVIKFDVKQVTEPGNIMKMFKTHLKRRKQGTSDDIPQLSLEEIKTIREEIKEIEIPEDVMNTIYLIQKELATYNIYVTSRTLNICLQILQSEAYFHGQTEVTEENLEILINCLWDDPDQFTEVYRVVLDKISPELPRIQELYHDCKDIYNQIVELEKKDDSQTEKITTCMEAGKKMKQSIKDINRHIQSLKERKKDVQEAEKYQQKIEELLNTILEKYLKTSKPK
jgi:MoxR-like ATPase